MPETTPVTETPVPVPSSLLADALKNPLALASRRRELVQLATDRANKLAADARTRVADARTRVADATTRVQALRKSNDAKLAALVERTRTYGMALPARFRRGASGQLLCAANALQALAKRIDPSAAAPEAPAAADVPAPTANA
jgi:hypothetical protein